MIKRFEGFIKEGVASYDKELDECNRILSEIAFRGNDAYGDEKYRFPVMTDELISPEACMKIGENGKCDICVSFSVVQPNTPVDFDDNGSIEEFPTDSLNPMQSNFLMGLYNWLVKEKGLSNVEYDDDNDSVIIHMEHNPGDGIDFEKYVNDVVVGYESMGVECFGGIFKRVFDWKFFSTYKKTS